MANMKTPRVVDRSKLYQTIVEKSFENIGRTPTRFDQDVDMDAFANAMDAYPSTYIGFNTDLLNIPENVVKMREDNNSTKSPLYAVMSRINGKYNVTDVANNTHIYHFSERFMFYSKSIANFITYDSVKPYDDVTGIVMMWIADTETGVMKYIGFVDLHDNLLDMYMSTEFINILSRTTSFKMDSKLVKMLRDDYLTNLSSGLFNNWKATKTTLKHQPMFSKGEFTKPWRRWIVDTCIIRGVTTLDFPTLKLFNVGTIY